jgi:hypothetical protein
MFTLTNLVLVFIGWVLIVSSGKAITRPKIVWWGLSGDFAQIKLFLY